MVVSALSSHFNVHFASNGERAFERLQNEVVAGLEPGEAVISGSAEPQALIENQKNGVEIMVWPDEILAELTERVAIVGAGPAGPRVASAR